jgi:glycerol-3-phosphate dehydrogenase
MKRDLKKLSDSRFDVLVVGGGIHGVICTWDAVLRGLSVALIERGDFGSATSQNSMKIIHGGIRYLQDRNLARIRTMVRERTTWMMIAPHMVQPLAFITPTYPNFSNSRFAMKTVLTLNDLFGYDRNRLPDLGKHLPTGQILSKEETARFLPGLDTTGTTGAALWYDAQVHNSERLLLSFVISASKAGAVVANYVEATRSLKKGASLQGVTARDVLSGQEFDIQARLIINSTGAWIDQLVNDLGMDSSKPHFSTSVGINLVTHMIWEGYAAGLRSHTGRRNSLDRAARREQLFFIVPWRNFSIIGTWHAPWKGTPDSFVLTTGILQEFIHEVNSAFPGLTFTLRDVLHVHYGFLPMFDSGDHGNNVRLVREGRVIDHQVEDGIQGLISLMGVKFTTARVMAQKSVDLAIRKLGWESTACTTGEVPVVGGNIEQFKDFLNDEQAKKPGGLPPDITEHLIYSYGSEYGEILHYLKEQPHLGKRVTDDSSVIKAEIIHAVRKEMAQNLVDVVQRRTELGATGLPSISVLKTCADLVGQELNWDTQQKSRAINQVKQAYPFSPDLG